MLLAYMVGGGQLKLAYALWIRELKTAPVTALCHCQHYGYYLLSPVLQHIGSMGNDLGGGGTCTDTLFLESSLRGKLDAKCYDLPLSK